MQTLVGKHLHKAVEPPIIIYHTVTDAPLVPLFGGLLSFFLNDHLPLGKIADYHSPFSQLVCDEMRSFMQTVSLFVVPAVALEPTNVVEASLVVDTRCQHFDSEIKSYNTIMAYLTLLPFLLLLARLVLP